MITQIKQGIRENLRNIASLANIYRGDMPSYDLSIFRGRNCGICTAAVGHYLLEKEISFSIIESVGYHATINQIIDHTIIAVQDGKIIIDPTFLQFFGKAMPKWERYPVLIRNREKIQPAITKLAQKTHNWPAEKAAAFAHMWYYTCGTFSEEKPNTDDSFGEKSEVKFYEIKPKTVDDLILGSYERPRILKQLQYIGWRTK